MVLFFFFCVHTQLIVVTLSADFAFVEHSNTTKTRLDSFILIFGDKCNVAIKSDSKRIQSSACSEKGYEIYSNTKRILSAKKKIWNNIHSYRVQRSTFNVQHSNIFFVRIAFDMIKLHRRLWADWAIFNLFVMCDTLWFILFKWNEGKRWRAPCMLLMYNTFCFYARISWISPYAKCFIYYKCHAINNKISSTWK